MDFVSIAVVAAADMEEVEVVDRHWFVAGFPIPAYIAPLDQSRAICLLDW